MRTHLIAGPIRLMVLAFLMLLALSMAGAGRPAVVSADEAGCDEDVVCLAAPSEATSAAAIGPAVAAPLPPSPPTVCGLRSGAVGIAVAVPAPPPPSCTPTRDLITTVNRANILYARALRTLDGSILGEAWTSDGLAELLRQIAALRDGGRYATPRLHTISLTSMDLGPNTATVRTTERWTYQERWRFSGELVAEQDQWARNDYYLAVRGGVWRVTRNDVALIPAPQPTPSVRVETDADTYAPGQTATLTMTNDSGATLVIDLGENCTTTALERQRWDGGWELAGEAPWVCLPTIPLQPGGRTSRIFAVWQPGTYRLRAGYRPSGPGNWPPAGMAYSRAFVIRETAPAPVIRVALDRGAYARGSTITAVIANDGVVPVMIIRTPECEITTAERQTPYGWEPVRGWPRPCAEVVEYLMPGARRTDWIAAGPFAGAYRIAFWYSQEGGPWEVVYSATYSVR